MKMMKKLFVFVTLFLGFLSSGNLFNVNAKTAPGEVTMKSKSSLYYYTETKGTDYISGYNFYRKELTDGTLAYCVSDIDTSVPAGKTLTSKGEITDKGLDYIIKNGYPNKSFTGDEKKDYYITQSAIWEYFDETRGSTNWKRTSFDSSSTGMKGYVYTLVQGAKAANKKTDINPTIDIIVLNKAMKLTNDGSYYISDPIRVNLTNTNGTYTVNIVSAPNGTIIKSTSGEVKNSYNNGEEFQIYVPTSSVKSTQETIKINISSTGVVKKAYSYTTGKSGYQDIAPVIIYEVINKIVSKEEVFKIEKQVTKVKISKQDVTSKQELPGATLTIKDESGKVVEEWVSTNEPKYIEGLKPGNYTLTEKIAPNGYVLSTESIKFTLREDGSVTPVVMYNAKENNPTEYDISKKDIASGEELPGATLTIKDKDGKVVEEWVSTNEPHHVKLPVGEYTLTEKIAPNGYILSTETIKFSVLKDGQVKGLTMYNSSSTTTKVKISKQDITTKEELPGATLTIKDESGKVVEEWVSTKTPYYIEGLKPGNYTLTEKIAPNGYILSNETIKFTVKSNGEVTSVVMFNQKYTEVPITDLNASVVTIIGASILMLLGTGLVLYAKHSN